MEKNKNKMSLEYGEDIPARESLAVSRKGRRRKYRRIQVFADFLIVLSFISGVLLGNIIGSKENDRTKNPASGQILFSSSHHESPLAAESAHPYTAEEQETPASEWNLILVNRENPLPDHYLIPELTPLKNGHSIDSRIYPALQQMMDDARSAGYEPLICSSYRTRQKQEQLFANEVQIYLNQGYSRKEAEEMASFGVAVPGTSEHQAGLAVDIVDMSYQLLDENQEDTPVQQWLMEHCAEYGFILRYPSDKSEITGIKYEPWHYRYVGVEAAKEIMEQGICLEEYLEP